MIVIRVTGFQERSDTMFQGHKRSTNREQFMTRHGSVVRLSIQIAPLPNSSIRPSSGLVSLRFLLHNFVVVGQLVTLGQITHHRVQPFAHASREVVHLFGCAIGLFAALTVVIDMHMLVFGTFAGSIVRIAKASLAIYFTGRIPCRVVVGADQTTWVILLGALRYTCTCRFIVFHLADSASTASNVGTGIN